MSYQHYFGRWFKKFVGYVMLSELCWPMGKFFEVELLFSCYYVAREETKKQRGRRKKIKLTFLSLISTLKAPPATSKADERMEFIFNFRKRLGISSSVLSIEAHT